MVKNWYNVIKLGNLVACSIKGLWLNVISSYLTYFVDAFSWKGKLYFSYSSCSKPRIAVQQHHRFNSNPYGKQ